MLNPNAPSYSNPMKQMLPIPCSRDPNQTYSIDGKNNISLEIEQAHSDRSRVLDQVQDERDSDVDFP